MHLPRKQASDLRIRLLIGTILLLVMQAFAGSLYAQAARSMVRDSGYGVVLSPRLEIADPAEGEKSVLLAIGLSTVLPGMGELYAGNFETGKYSLIAEGVLWVAFGAFKIQSNTIETDARLFARQHSGADFGGKSDQYAVDVGNYQSVDEYNQEKLKNREYDRLYDKATYSWNWDNGANRQTFRNLRIDSDKADQASGFVVGALVINRIISAISAGRAAARHNEALLNEQDWSLSMYPLGNTVLPSGFEFRISRRF